MGMVGYIAPVSAATLEELRRDPESVEDYLYPDGGDGAPPNQVDVDKAWHGLHYLLTGRAEGGAEPLAWALLGGEEIGPELGYGPARYLTPPQVAAVAAALSDLDDQALARRFDADDMDAQDIYPDIWARDGREALEYLLAHFAPLAGAYRGAADRGDAMLLWMA